MRRATQPPESESPATIRDRGAVGAALLTIREAGAQVVAFIGMLVLAHLLSPTELGMVAFGTTVVTIGNFFADGGLGAALIRRADHPSVDELRTLLALQLILAIVIALAVAVVGIPGRHDRSRHGDHGVLASAAGPQSSTRDRPGARARVPAHRGH